MRAVFVNKLSNVQKFMAGTIRVEQRGAVEACWHLAEGDPGKGKSRTLEYWATQHDAVLLRAKSGWTLNWALRDLVTELGETPSRRSEQLFHQAMMRIARGGKPIVVDEIDHALHDRRVIEMLRDISDLTATPIIIAGMSGVGRALRRYEQIYSRIAVVTTFEDCTLEDVALICTELCEVDVEETLAATIHERTAGRLREIMNAVKEVERHGKKRGLQRVTAAEMPLALLTNDGRPRGAIQARRRAA
jgi:hypothetical protein